MCIHDNGIVQRQETYDEIRSSIKINYLFGAALLKCAENAVSEWVGGWVSG